ncbi:5-oxoprolinase subunit PxpA [Methylobacterium organophilum]|uniref:LamB/YcsF family protein n=1 Tax=Methylobacterium organophilum TaxID=410 RepID=UPI001F145FB3|nr:5-oxoprolinase subunit PxpA [Methylobacterium organophilum]UMY16061.1 5-oxoprolinase subunit PxpA [Methylobacterium organophilum]
MSTARIDLNADLGEGYGPWRLGEDEALLDVVTSASIACGFHAGDPTIMVETAAAAKARSVAIGAHPGFHDLRGFGRQVIRQPVREIERDVAYQIGAMQACAALAGHRVSYVKAHGALANLANAEPEIAKAVARAVAGVDRGLALMVMPGLAAERAAESVGLRSLREIYADRAYAEDGQLAPRGTPGAVIHDAEAIAARVLRMVEEGGVLTASGQLLPVGIDTVCVHGDTPGALTAARAVRAGLERAGIAVEACCGA